MTEKRAHIHGIEEYMYKNAPKFEKVRKHVINLLKGKIIVGHTIRHDLEVLQISDASFVNIAYYSKNHKYPEALRRLARRVLNAAIQVDTHSSIIDARATMALFRMNMRYFELRLKRNRAHGHN